MNSNSPGETALILFAVFSVTETQWHTIEPDKAIVLGECPVGVLCPMMRKLWSAKELLSQSTDTMTKFAKAWKVSETLLWELLNADFGDHPSIPSNHRVLAVRRGFQVVSRPDNSRGDWHWLEPHSNGKPIMMVQQIGDFFTPPGLFAAA